MATHKRFRPSILLEFFLDSVLLLLFIGQAFVLGCLWIYGYLPLPTGLCNRLIAVHVPEGYDLQIGSFHLRPDGAIDLVDIQARATHIEQPLFTAKLSEINLSWSHFPKLPEIKSFVLSGGTLHVPSIYSPDGHHTPLVKRIAFRAKPHNGSFRADRFAALHDEIRLNGSFDIPTIQHDGPSRSPEESLDLFYKYAAKLWEQKQYIRYFETPTVSFRFFNTDTDAQELTLRVSSRTFNHPEAEATNVQLRSVLLWDAETLSPIKAPTFSALELKVPGYQASASDLIVEITTTNLNSLFKGTWPPVCVAAKEIKFREYSLDAPVLTIDPKVFPEIQFFGATRSLDNGIELSGSLDAHTWEAQVRARGSVDLNKVAPKSVIKHLPKIQYDSSPYCDLNVTFTKGFVLQSADLRAQVETLHVDALKFDYFNARASYRDGIYTVEDLHIRRKRQWFDILFTFDTSTQDYHASLIGSAVPSEYNALLPDWWAPIFEDIDFSKASYSLGNFIINGNTGDPTKIFFYGQAETRGVSYKGLLLDTGNLTVRGGESYTELHDLDATSGQGWAKGDISFSSIPGVEDSYASTRLDLDAKLTLEDAAKLLDGDIAEIIADFSTDGLLLLKLKGAIFDDKHPQFADKTYFNVFAQCPAPIQFDKVPLDHLNFNLYGRPGITSLRKVSFGYADGKGSAQVDIATPDKGTTSLRYQLDLVDADQGQAVRDLPHLDQIEDSMDTAPEKESKPQESEEARVDLQIHGEGPTDDSFKHSGFGYVEIRSQQLGTIQLLGPLSRLLQKTLLNFTTLNLNELHGNFTYTNDVVHFKELRIDGPLTRIDAPGTLNLVDQSIEARVSVSLFGNDGNPDSSLRKIGDFITKPLPNLLQFELTGTIEDQKIRSLYDPRKYIPLL